MADVLMNHLGVYSVFELVGNKSVPQVIDFDIFQTGFFEITVDAGTDVADQKRPAGLGDKDMIVLDLRADSQVVLQGSSRRSGKKYIPGRVVFDGTNMKFVFPDVVQAEIGQFGNLHTGLEQELNDGTDSDIQSDGVAESLVLVGRENAGRFNFVFGMDHILRGIGEYHFFGMHVTEKSFHGVDLAADAFGGIGLGKEGIYIFFEKLGGNGGSLGDALLPHMIHKLLEIAAISNSGCGRPAF